MTELTKREKLLAFGGILVVLFLTSLNLTVVGTALPRIIAELEGFKLYAWAFTAYSLTSTVTLPIYGKLSDIYGRKRILLFGILLFSGASALGGFAQSMPQLIVTRALQGLGGGALISMAFSAIGDIFTPRERGAYQGFTGAVFGFSSVVGPLVGGLITDTIGWRWVFFVNVPIALIAYFVIRRYFPGVATKARGGIDFVGSGLLMLGIVPLLLALTWGGVDLPWSSPPILGLFGLAVVLLAAFMWWQRKTPNPVLDPDLFSERTFNVANIGGFLSGVGMFGAVIYLPLYIQGVQGGSAAASGFALTPLMLGMVVSSTVAGLLVSRTGRYKPFVIAGLATITVGFVLNATMDASTPLILTVAYSVVLGLGFGPTNSLFVLAVQNALPQSKLGTATSANMFFRQIGGTIGVAVFGALVAATIAGHVSTSLPPELQRLPPNVIEEFTSPNLLTSPAQLELARVEVDAVAAAGTFEALVQGLREALASGLGRVFMVGAALSLLGLISAFFLPVLELRTTISSEPPPPARQPRSATSLPAATVGRGRD
ncbi:MAG TPA: MDR family MFS transporter [Trueperaceae bacterium]|nr:MDR family MFS transporter [Trueperaceae bacterium]